MKPIHWADQLAIQSIWRASKLKMEDAGYKGTELMEKTARLAEKIVRRTQPMWSALTMGDLDRAARKNPFVKLMMMFSSQRTQNFNMVFTAFSRYRHGEISSYQFAKNLMIPTVIQAAMIYAIRTAAMSLMGGPGEDKDFKDHVTGITETVLGNWVIAGELIAATGKAVEKQLTTGKLPDEIIPDNILASAAEDATRGLLEYVQAIKYSIDDEKYETGPRKGESKAYYTAWRATERAAGALGIVTGLPFQGIAMATRKWLPHRRLNEEQVMRMAVSKANSLTMNIPKEEEKKNDLKRKQADIMKWIVRYNVDTKKLREEYLKSLRSKYKEAGTRAKYYQRLNRILDRIDKDVSDVTGE